MLHWETAPSGEKLIKRSNWLDVLANASGEVHTLTLRHRHVLSNLDDALFEAWNLGNNIVLIWTREADEYRFLSVRHYAIIEPFGSGPGVSDTPGGGDFINGVLAAPKRVTPGEFQRIGEILGKASHVLRMRITPDDRPGDELVTQLVTRYGVSLVHERAVVLLDAVGFSLYSPLEQVAMLNSLSYSVNVAYRQLLSKDIDINFARTTTGDGFYIWNRACTVDANIALYKLMMLILTDNAVAQRKAKLFPVPKLRAAFHVGKHYEFYQVEALNPTTFAYIVGQVTIELSRMIEQALPGQILLGDFKIGMGRGAADVTHCDTLAFVAKTAATLDQMRGLTVGNDQIDRIRCYLTGEADSSGRFLVASHRIRDKHGLIHTVYNAKINIHRQRAEPIFLGIQHKDCVVQA